MAPGTLEGPQAPMNRNVDGQSIHQRMANRFEVDQRAALFGSRFAGKGGGRGRGSHVDMHASMAREEMEAQNNAQIEDLEAKVGQLKEITRNINREVTDSNSFLDGMSLDFDKAGLLLRDTLGNLKVMVKKGGGKHMCSMVVFVVFLFFTFYMLRGVGSRFGGSSATSIELKQNATSDSGGG